MNVRRELLEVEEEFWQAAGDRERYATNLAADAIHVFPGWGVAEREAVLCGVAEAEPWKTFSIDDPDVLILSDESAALVYRTRAQRVNEPPYEATVRRVLEAGPAPADAALQRRVALTCGASYCGGSPGIRRRPKARGRAQARPPRQRPRRQTRASSAWRHVRNPQ